MTKGSYKVKRKNPVSADGAMQTKRFLDRFRFRNVERLGLDELPGMKSLTVEYMISSIDAAMAHEGLPLSRENKQMMKDWGEQFKSDPLWGPILSGKAEGTKSTVDVNIHLSGDTKKVDKVESATATGGLKKPSNPLKPGGKTIP